MEITLKLIFSVIGSIGLLGLLYALFRFIIIKFFTTLIETQLELIEAKNDHAKILENHSGRIDRAEKDILEIKKECRSHWKWRDN